MGCRQKQTANIALKKSNTQNQGNPTLLDNSGPLFQPSVQSCEIHTQAIVESNIFVGAQNQQSSLQKKASKQNLRHCGA